MRIATCFAAVAFTAACQTSRADVVWSDAGISGGGWPLTTNPMALSLADAGVGSFGESASATADASLDGGYIKASVAGTVGNMQIGGGSVRVGLQTDILLQGPADQAGRVAVTVRLDGMHGGPGANNAFVMVETGKGLGDQFPNGFAPQDPADRGYFRYDVHAVYGESVDCRNCTYRQGNDFLAYVTTYLPFEAGQSSVRYGAAITLGTGGSFVDVSNTAIFDIDLPEGFTATSQLRFVDLGVAPAVPEPGSWALWLAGLGAAQAVASVRRRGQEPKRA